MTRPQTAVYWALAALYLIVQGFSPFPMEWAVKVAPIWWLAGCVIVQPDVPRRQVLIAAVLFGSVGDILLALGGFIGGLGAFLVAQLLYATLFSRQFKWRPERLSWAFFLALWAAAVLLWVWTSLGAFKAPVLAYLVAISLMGLAAIFSRFPLWPGVIGAGTFILSDSLIAIGRFIEPLPAQDLAVMLSYYGAQWMIVRALMTRNVDS
ncbi:lysoplasmalogenase [Saccharospirillum salsuginis]|uniref:Lysoplasmalogenase n=1 Tax=Saccharospirillum salsuginis TaxID=418750 RepID=A0A918KRP9_9GAMM|nr:lysoplasmalogenase [Saccharospirillum salsuginis]GGX70932.1 hypothetical protein GCM10007392_43010 [Saccharospirillum salsuginis]